MPAPSFLMDFLSSQVNPIIGGGTTSITTSANRTYTNSAGVLTQNVANAGRFDYNPSTLAMRGLLIEEARINLFLNSLLNGTNLSTQGVPTVATPYALSFYGTGTDTLSGTAVATVNGSGAYPTRTTSVFTPSAGTLTNTITGTVQYAQIEAGSFATSFIPTAGTSVTGGADTLTLALGSWYNATEGTFVVEFINRQTQSSAPIVCGVHDGTNNNRIQIFMSGTDVPSLFSVNGGVVQVNQAGASAVTNNAISRVAFAYKASDHAICVNGGTVTTIASGTIPTVTTLCIGSGVGGLQYINGWIRRITYYPTRLQDAMLIMLAR